MKQRITRRGFVAGAAAAAATAYYSPTLRAQGANDDIRIAVIGFNGQGKSHIEGYKKMKGVRLVALCDADQQVIDKEMAKIQAENYGKVDGYQDMRRVFDDKNIDAISTATPNYWHALTSIWAVQSGKDVYVEKPVSHNIWEGRKIVEAARKYNKIVQTGTQKRSSLGLKKAFEITNSGKLGKLLYARGFCYKRRDSIGKVSAPTPIPASVDYDLWCGPAAKEPLMRKRLHYDWHWVWNTGNGDIGNQGIHEMDICRWALGENELAPEVYSFGGRFGYEDDANTPNTIVSIYNYKKAPLIFETRGLPSKPGATTPMDAYKGVRVGNVIQCENGYYAGGDNGGFLYDNDGKQIEQLRGEGIGQHKENFIKAVRSRKVSDLNADILEGHLSSALCHMGNISYRVGQEIGFNEAKERLKADKEVLARYESTIEHLAANGVDLGKEKIVLGPVLKLDPKKEVFVGDLADKANAYIKRDYRAPFIVPDQV